MEAARRLREKDDFLILTHKRPDGDTMGSAAALCHALRDIGKRAYVYNNPQFSDYMPWITKDYLSPEGFTGEYIIAVDTAAENLFPIGFAGSADLCIDHHRSNTGYAAETLLMSGKASCGEVVMEVIEELAGSISKPAADLLYIAVSTDTGCFVYGNTTSETHLAAARLCQAGACNTALNKLLFRTSSRERLALEGLIYSSLRYYHSGKTVFAVITRDMMRLSGATEQDCSDISALPGRVEGVTTSAVIREITDTRCKISVRSDGNVSASNVCSRFGGGGHLMAGGCDMDKSVDEAARLLEKAILEERK